MRTRRSWRNQERLWKALGHEQGRPQSPSPPVTEAEIDAMFWMRRDERARLKKQRRAKDA